jgi:REP element-mobilizing transposase RayT
MSRGDDRKKVYTSASDYRKFMDYVVKAKERYQFYLYAYCLMPNHFHLLLETKLPNLSRIMHFIKGSYTTYYNIRYHRTGHLFQGRFKSIVIDKDSYFLELSRYLHLNPVRAGVVKDPVEYVWSSYHGYLGKKDKYLDCDQVKQCLGMTSREYRRFVLAGLKEQKSPLEKVYAGFLLGSVAFIKNKLKDLEIQVTSEEVVQKSAMLDDKERTEQIIEAVLTYFHMTLEQLRIEKSRPMRAKQILIYLLREHTGLTNRTIGDIVGMRYPAVSKARATIERLLHEDKQVQRMVTRIVSSFQV